MFMHQNARLSSAAYGHYFINQVFSRENTEALLLLTCTPEMQYDMFRIVGLRFFGSGGGICCFTNAGSLTICALALA